MRATGSTRTGTRWRSSRSGAGDRTWATLALAALLPLSACVTQTASYFVPTPGQPRFSTDDARDEIDAVLRAECPRLLAANTPSGAASLNVDFAGSGDVQRARITQPSSDARMDQVFGAVAARMHFKAPDAAAMKGQPTVEGRLRMGFSCAKDAAVGTVEIL